MNRCTYIFSILILSLISGSASAMKSTPDSTINLDEVIVRAVTTSDRMRDSKFSASGIDVAGKISANTDITSIIDRAPGITIRREGGIGSDFELSVNGMSGNSVRYFIDGVPLESLGIGMTISSLPAAMIDHLEVFKGVVPGYLGGDILGGAVNIITRATSRNWLDASLSLGSFHSYGASVNARWSKSPNAVIFKPSFSFTSSKNDYTMKGVEVWDEDQRKYIKVDRKRFHDDYRLISGMLEASLQHRSWADMIALTANIAAVDKEIQTGSVQSKVIGDATRSELSFGAGLKYLKRDIFTPGLNARITLSQSFNISETTDTAMRKYDWNGHWIYSQRNEITGRGPSIRHYYRPATIATAVIDYRLKDNSDFTLNYLFNLSGNRRKDDLDTEFEPSDDKNSGVHFDLFLTIGKHGGMNLGDGTIVRTLPSVDDSQPTVDIKGTGLEFRAGDNTLSMEAIVKDGYYYQVPNSNDRFVKFKVGESAITVVNEQPFVKNTYKVRSYTHTWLPGNVLLIAAANGTKDEIIWTKINASDLSIIQEGTLNIPLTKDAATFTTSGLLSYNEKTGKLYYFYYGKTSGSGMKSTRVGNFHVATLNPESLAVMSDFETPLAEEMTGSAFGELMQNFIAYDEAGNLYLSAFSTLDGNEIGKILKINAGENNFDSSYNAFPNPDGKIHTLQYLAAGKALIYVRENARGTKSDAFSKYYAIVDLATGERHRVKYNGDDLPYSSGGFSQRTAIHKGKAYIGVCAEGGKQGIYIYDIKTGEVSKGVDIAPGYYFDILRVIE